MINKKQEKSNNKKVRFIKKKRYALLMRHNYSDFSVSTFLASEAVG